MIFRLLGIDFFEVTYRVYDREVRKMSMLCINMNRNMASSSSKDGGNYVLQYVEVVTPVVSRAVKELKPFGLSGNDGPEQDKRMSSGTVLFELYLAIKQFAE